MGRERGRALRLLSREKFAHSSELGEEGARKVSLLDFGEVEIGMGKKQLPFSL